MIDIAMTTWPNHPLRLEYFTRTLKTLKKHLTASNHQIRFVCSAETKRDPMFPWQGDGLEELCKRECVELHWREAKPNLGANMNAAIRLCTSPIIMVQQDDWMLKEDLDISPGAEFMLAHSEIDLLRYSWPDVDFMRPKFRDRGDGWNDVHIGSEWLYGDDPHLRRQDFMEKWGWYLEGGPHASASADLMGKLRRGDARLVASQKCYFQHFGQISSYPRAKEPRPRRRR